MVAKLQRKKRNMTDATLEHFISMTGGLDPTQLIDEIQQLSAVDAKDKLLSLEDLFVFLDDHKSGKGRSVVISDAEDEVISHTRGYGDSQTLEDYLDDFADFVKSNMNEIAALNIVCTRPKDLTRESLKNLRLTLDREGFTAQKLNTAISKMTNVEITADIISLIRRYAIGSALVSHEIRIQSAVDKLRKAHQFSTPELTWIARMEKYLLEESVLNIDVFDEDGRFKAQGGFARLNQIFKNQLESVVQELNEYLYDDGGKIA